MLRACLIFPWHLRGAVFILILWMCCSLFLIKSYIGAYSVATQPHIIELFFAANLATDSALILILFLFTRTCVVSSCTFWLVLFFILLVFFSHCRYCDWFFLGAGASKAFSVYWCLFENLFATNGCEKAKEGILIILNTFHSGICHSMFSGVRGVHCFLKKTAFVASLRDVLDASSGGAPV